MNCRSISTTEFTQPVHSRNGEEEMYFLHFRPVTEAGRRSTFKTAVSTTADCAKSCLWHSLQYLICTPTLCSSLHTSPIPSQPMSAWRSLHTWQIHTILPHVSCKKKNKKCFSCGLTAGSLSLDTHYINHISRNVGSMNAIYFFSPWQQKSTWIFHTTIQNAKIYNCAHPTANAMNNPTEKRQINVTKMESTCVWYKIGFFKLYVFYLRKCARYISRNKK